MNAIKITAVTQTDGRGQWVRWLKIAYPLPIAAEAVTRAHYIVKNRTVQEVYVNTTGSVGVKETAGRFVLIELSRAYEQDSTYKHLHDVAHGRIVMNEVVAVVLQTIALTAADGTVFSEWRQGEAVTDYDEQCPMGFRQYTWKDPVSQNYLNYHLYVPQSYDPNQSYPMVLFIHDAGACSTDMPAALAQGMGGVIWASEHEQKKHPCFVLVPCYTQAIVEDDWSETWEVEATRRLVQEITGAWSVDKGRVYATGQSMGCMTLCVLNSRYPGLFASSLLVAGQWDPEVTRAMKDCRIWILVSEKDEKAFPGMQAVAKSIEMAGGSVTRGMLDATDSLENQNAQVRRIAQTTDKTIFTYYVGDSVLRAAPEGGHPHPKTWCCAYRLEALRDWLLKDAI